MILDLYKETISNCEAVFIDIFDTIIYRKNYPDYNKQLWCEALKKIYDLNIKLNKFITLRNNIEIKLRKKNKKNGYSFEFNYNEFLSEMYNRLKLKVTEEEFKQCATQIELDIEFNSQFVFKDILDVLNYAKSKNKKIYCISDMYMTKGMIVELLKRHNIKKYIDDVYVSSEFLKNKVDGTLYDYIKKQQVNLNISKCIMFGDNYWYDYRNSVNAGFNGFFIDRGYLFNHYKKIKDNCINKKYLNKLKNISAYYENFFDELYNYEQLKEICFEIYKCGEKTIKYSKKDFRIINRLKKLQNELYLHKKVSFVISDNSNISINNHKIIFNSKEYLIKEFDKDESCFNEIMKVLTNILYGKLDKNFLSKKNTSLKLEIPIEDLKKLGKQYTPLFKDFANWILNDIKQKKIEKIYFFTREGEFFKKVFDKINKDSNIRSYILEVSRVSTFFPSLSKVDIKELNRLWSQYSVQSLSALFKSLNLDIDKYIDLIIKYNLNIDDEIICPQDNINLNRLFSDKKFVSLMTEDLNSTKSLLEEYFASKDFVKQEKNIAIVDIGWRGTIQDNICYIFPNINIYGYYFGLEKFLNEQPKNAYKYGYINQYYGKEKILGDITPFEMLCNSCNGSTIGYKKDESGVRAIRKIDEFENKSYNNCTKFIQEGVLANLNNKGIDTNKSFEEMVNIIYNPHKYVALTYFDLKHNEEFGLGEYVSKQSHISKKSIRKGIYNWESQKELMHKLEQTSWPYGYLVANDLIKLKDKLPLKVLSDYDSIKRKKRIAWIMPDLLEGSGGHRTIISNANYLVKKGYQCDLYFNEDYVSTSEQLREKIVKYFGECNCQVYVGLRLRCDYDMVFATYSITTPEIVKNSDCKHKMYFVQDFEPWFNAMGDGYISMENTYRYGFRIISIGKWLEHKLSAEYGAEITSFPFCADLSVYRPIKIEKEYAICFIFQPDKPRRCVELGLQALKLVKAIKPNLKIYLYGSKQEYNVDFEHENLHIISLEECNKLYNKCKVGLCISSSNPSRIPFEMMASGLPVVDVYRENNLYDMPDEGVTLAYSTPQSIATSILTLLDDDNLAKKKSEFGIKFMKNYDINKGYEIFGDTIDNIFNDIDKLESTIEKQYKVEPIPVRKDVKKFELLLKYNPVYHETTDYLRRLVGVKRKITTTLSIKKILNKIKRIIKKILNKTKRIIKRIIKKILRMD